MEPATGGGARAGRAGARGREQGLRGTLATRLQALGLAATAALPGGPGGGLPGGEQPAPLAQTAAEKRVFTPLAQQGLKAWQRKTKRKEDAPQDVLSLVKSTRKRCVAASGAAPAPAEVEPAPSGALAKRLQALGLEATAALPGGPGGELPGGEQPAPLAQTAAEKRVFTPLAQQGEKRKEDAPQDVFSHVKSTIKRWVQESLAREDKRKKLLEKGMLKCCVQAQWSEFLHEKLKELVSGYGGKLISDTEKDKSKDKDKDSAEVPEDKPPAYLPRKEKWLVGFNLKAFEACLRDYPDLMGPVNNSLKTFVDSYCAVPGSEAKNIKELYAALEEKYGPLQWSVLDRAKMIATEVMNAKMEAGEAGKWQKRSADGKPKGKGKGKVVEEVPTLTTEVECKWAASILAPLGLNQDGSLVIWCPASAALPVLKGLQALSGTDHIQKVVRNTPIGKIVNAYRHHSNNEASKLARELLGAWKAACGFGPKQAARAEKEKGNAIIVKRKGSANAIGAE